MLSVTYAESRKYALDAECHYAECRYVECRKISLLMLSVIMLSVVMLSVVMLSVVMLNVVMLSVVAPPGDVSIQIMRKINFEKASKTFKSFLAFLFNLITKSICFRDLADIAYF